jgi:hypothetical protein
MYSEGSDIVPKTGWDFGKQSHFKSFSISDSQSSKKGLFILKTDIDIVSQQFSYPQFYTIHTTSWSHQVAPNNMRQRFPQRISTQFLTPIA